MLRLWSRTQLLAVVAVLGSITLAGCDVLAPGTGGSAGTGGSNATGTAGTSAAGTAGNGSGGTGGSSATGTGGSTTSCVIGPTTGAPGFGAPTQGGMGQS